MADRDIVGTGDQADCKTLEITQAMTDSPDVGPSDPVAKVFYSKDGVILHVEGRDGAEVHIPGRLELLVIGNSAYVEWQPLGNFDYKTDDESEWAVITPSPNQQDAQSPHADYAVKFAVADITGMRKDRARLGWQRIIFTLRDKGDLPSFHFQGSNCHEFWTSLHRFAMIRRSADDSTSYDVTDGAWSGIDPLSMGTPGDVISPAFANYFSEESLLAGFSKVTQFVRHLGSEVGLRPDEGSGTTAGRGATATPAALKTTGHSTHSASPTSPRPGYDFELVEESEITILPAWTADVCREMPIDLAEWQEYLDGEGRVVKETEFRRRLFKGGLEPSLRHHVWKFLLSHYDFDSSAAGREKTEATRQSDYNVMHLQWSSMLPSQKKRFDLLRDRVHLIKKDVHRTDRSHPRFKDDNSIYLVKMSNILTTYCFYNFNLGYVQGMSDLCSPIVDIMEDEVQAFWCFAGFMDMVEDNFAEDQEPMRRQLATLHAMLKVADMRLSDYLAAQESDNLYFCFRWLLVLFKRELSYEDTMRLWEVLWSKYLTPHFHLFCALALLLQGKKTIISKRMGFNEIIKYVNELCGHIDLDVMLIDAEILCQRFMAVRDKLPAEVVRIIPPDAPPLKAGHQQGLSDSLTLNSVTCTADGSALLSASPAAKATAASRSSAT